MHTTVFAQGTNEFQKSQKCDILKKCVKINFSLNFKCLVFSLVDLTNLLPTELKSDINFNQNHFSSKKHIFCIFNQKKNRGLKDNFS